MSIAANTSTLQRTGLVTIAGQGFTVTQAGTAACAYTISPTAYTAAPTGASTSISVTAATGCIWSAASGVSWIMVNSGSSGSGNGTVAVTVAANTTTAARTGTVTIAGRTWTVSQAAGACTYTVTPGSLSVSALGMSSSLSVATGTTCSWAPSGMPSWITMATTTRTGSGMLSYTIAPNSGSEARTATLSIGGKAVTVTQSAAAPAPPSGFRVIDGGTP
jgi:hypothetical protein